MMIELEMPPVITSNEQDLLVEQIRRWGDSSCDAQLDPLCQVFTYPGCEGVICYKETKDCVAVIGEPAAPAGDKERLAEAFHAFHERQGRPVVWIAVSDAFATWALQHISKIAMELTEHIVFDAQLDPMRGNRGALARRKVRRAIKNDVTAEEYLGQDSSIEDEMNRVGEEWLAQREGLQIHISNVRLFEDRPGKRWFYAKQHGKIIGVLVLNQLQSYDGWHINHLMTTPDAPGGTSELIVVTAFKKVNREGNSFLSAGSVLLPEPGEIRGLGKIGGLFVRMAIGIAKRLFPLGGTGKFWDKFQPETSRAFCLFSRRYIGKREIWCIIRALNII